MIPWVEELLLFLHCLGLLNFLASLYVILCLSSYLFILVLDFRRQIVSMHVIIEYQRGPVTTRKPWNNDLVFYLNAEKIDALRKYSVMVSVL